MSARKALSGQSRTAILFALCLLVAGQLLGDFHFHKGGAQEVHCAVCLTAANGAGAAGAVSIAHVYVKHHFVPPQLRPVYARQIPYFHLIRAPPGNTPA